MPAPVVDYLPVATQPGSTVDTQAAFIGSGYQTQGFQNGVASPSQINKILRQVSIMVAAIANFISQQLNISVLDDGNLANLITNLTNAIRQASSKILVVPYAPAPQFDASQSSKFETTLTGDMAPTLINTSPGQRLVFIIHEDAIGTHAFTPPANLPMADINNGAGVTNIQAFEVMASGVLIPSSPLMWQ